MNETTAKGDAEPSVTLATPRMTLETTLFDRLLALHGTSIKRMLTVQYRMHEKIMQFPSAELCVYSLRYTLPNDPNLGQTNRNSPQLNSSKRGC
jgi:hypothetical protein